MNRRMYLSSVATITLPLTTGCLDSFRVQTTFEHTPTGVDVTDPPVVELENRSVRARGTVRYGSSNCGTIELAHAQYERSQQRLDLLVVAANDSWIPRSCHDDLVDGGYRLEAQVRSSLRRVTVTEHHVFGEAYSTSRSA